MKKMQRGLQSFNSYGRFLDGTTSHSTRLPKDGNQVVGYLHIPLIELLAIRLGGKAAKSLVIPQAGEGGSMFHAHVPRDFEYAVIGVHLQNSFLFATF